MTRRSRFALYVFASLTLLILATVASATPNVPVEVAFIDVGQGDSTLIRSDDFAVLIDGGLPSAGPTVVAFLHQQEVPDLDVMLVTHADGDHIGGLEDVLTSGIPVRQVLYNGYAGDTATWTGFATAVANAGLTLTAAQSGQVLTWGETTAYVLNPQPGLTNTADNDLSVVVRLDHGSVHYLLTGDASSTVEAAIVASATPVAAQILKVGHHGSKYSSSETFLAAVQPEQAVITVGENNRYGHPAPETLARLQAAGATIWRTDQDGTITVTDDGNSYQVQAEVEMFLVFLPLAMR